MCEAMDTCQIDEHVSDEELQGKILKHLCNAVNVLPKCANLPALRSYYLDICGSLNEVKVPKSELRARCKYCYQPFDQGAFALKLSPKKSPGKRMRRIFRKASSEDSKLSRIEKKLLLNAQKNPGNKLILKCSTCQKETVKPMGKPPLSERYVVEEVPEVPERKKKKKKKKSKNAGLKIPAGTNFDTNRKLPQIPDSVLLSLGEKKKRGLNVEQKKFLLGTWGSGKQKKEAERRKKRLTAKLSSLKTESQGSSLTDLFRNLGRKLV